MTWKKGKIFKKGNKMVRYIYKNGRKAHKRLVEVERMAKTAGRYHRYGKKAYRSYKRSR